MIIEGRILTRKGRFYGQVQTKEGRIISVKQGVKGNADLLLGKTELLCPALYDSHVHLRDLLELERETIQTGIEHLTYTGTLGASAMPNTNPALNNAAVLEEYVNRIKKHQEFDGSVYGLLTPNSAKEELEKMRPYCDNKYKAFQASSVGAGFFTNNEQLKKQIMLLPEGAEIRVHCEDSEVLKAHEKEWEPKKPWTHMNARPGKAEAEGIRYVIEEIMPLRPDLTYVICHLSSKEGAKLVKEGKKKHSNLFCELAYHHAYFYKKHYKTKGVKIKCNPAIRTKKDRKSLIKMLKKGLIDYLVSDHAPHTEKNKLKDYYSGLPSYNGGVFGWLVKKRIKSEHLIKAGTKKEWEIKEGNQAKMMVLDLKGRIVKEAYQKTKAKKVSPWNGEKLPFVKTVINGDCIINTIK